MINWICRKVLGTRVCDPNEGNDQHVLYFTIDWMMRLVRQFS